jgi:hypothetical protein
MNYHTTSLIHLSLEEYTNQGLSQAKIKEAIESLRDPGGTSNLWCTESGINHNLNVHTMLTDEGDIHGLVLDIQEKILDLLPAS